MPLAWVGVLMTTMGVPGPGLIGVGKDAILALRWPRLGSLRGGTRAVRAPSVRYGVFDPLTGNHRRLRPAMRPHYEARVSFVLVVVQKGSSPEGSRDGLAEVIVDGGRRYSPLRSRSLNGRSRPTGASGRPLTALGDGQTASGSSRQAARGQLGGR